MTKQEIEKLVSQFSDKSLPKEDWTHEAHILVAIWHNWHFEFATALDMVRSKIISFNEAVGTENSDTSGYHETMTVFWMRLTNNFLKSHRFEQIESACFEFLKSENALNSSPFKYYTKQKLFSLEARKSWVDGDIKSIEFIK